MHLLSAIESLSATDALLLSLYGEDLFYKWKDLKKQLNFSTEREFIGWMLSLATVYSYSDGDVEEEGSFSYYHNVKYELGRQEGEICEEQSRLSVGINNMEKVANADRDQTNMMWEEQSSSSDVLDPQSFISSPATLTNSCSEIIDGGATPPQYNMNPLIIPASTVVFGEERADVPSAITNNTRGVSATDFTDTVFPFRCDICGKGVVSRRNLQRHQISVHHQWKRYSCPYCDLSCTRQDSVRRHIINAHANKHNILPDEVEPPVIEGNSTTATSVTT